MQHELKADKLQCIEHKVIGIRTVCVRYRGREKALEAMNADSSVNQLKARFEGFGRNDVPWSQINFL